MKMINENQARIKALATSQRETDRMLTGLIRSRERGRKQDEPANWSHRV